MKKKKWVLILSSLIIFSFCSDLFAARGIRIKLQTASGSTKEVQLYSEYHALVVGVSDYDHWPDLPNATTDAMEVTTVLKKLGFKVKTILNPSARELDLVLNDMVFRIGSKKERALLFYYAGHGETLELADGTRLGYLIPSDTPLKKQDPLGFDDKAVSMKEIESMALKVQAKHLLMLFDSCFSGSIFNLTRAAPTDISEKSILPVRQFITAGAAGEQVPDRSIFKIVTLDGIKGDADLNEDGYVTGSELGMHLQSAVVNYTRGGQHPQYGKINNPKLDKGDFIFITGRKPKAKKPAKPVALKPQKAGLLVINTQPVGAEIKINGKSFGKSPVTLDKLKPGRIKVTASLNGYEDQSREIWFSRNRDTRITLSLTQILTTGYLSIRSTPEGAEWYFNDAYVGLTPDKITEIPPGKYQVIVKFQDHKDWTSEVEIVAGKRVSITAIMDPMISKGKLYVKTVPADARIRILNIKPKFAQGMEFDAGKYLIEVSAEGYETKTQWITLAPREDKNFDVTLQKTKPKTGRLFVSTDPPNARVKLLNSNRGYYSGMELLAGRYHLEISASGYETKEEWLQIEKEEEQRISVHLKKKGRQQVATIPSSSGTKTLTGLYKYPNGIIYDPKTKLEWYVGPNQDTNWNEAKRWVKNLTIAGGGWRMPSRSELKSLRIKGVGEQNVDPVFEVTGGEVWSGETKDGNAAYYYILKYMNDGWYYGFFVKGPRVFAVRSRR